MLSGVLNLRGVRPDIPRRGALAYRFENDPARMKQSNAGTGAVAAAADPIGYWENMASNRHLTSSADSGIRPALAVTNGIPELQFDGTDDILRNLNDPGLYTQAGFTATLLVRTNAIGTVKTIFGASDNTVGSQFMGIIGSNSATAANGNTRYSNDTGLPFIASSVNHYTSAHPGTNKVVTVVDDGDGVTWRVDGVWGTRQAYTRSGNAVTLNNISLGGIQRLTAVSHAPFYTQGLFVWPKANLTSEEISQIEAYGMRLQGRAP